ncbi:hypothetical protein N781_03285 [Pontibacillus halophilus JSM 076056 = DSM 19796]|uniref:FbpB family small basic protein n=1 Tax=Pontibacillus halophilus JSM 076056 = DSM 19796 TaxID=1385510 RepID=A0A0A5GFP7_9BACI|nr:FbpB family small basic protein [Pontibacillus halophilus]KGX92051.1 hypothetical protein N781_03285 [Pontibacillus halophilus JSM 076056 = DSM 19796]
MARKRKPTFEELINMNRKEMSKDQELLDKIDQKIEKRMNDSLTRPSV